MSGWRAPAIPLGPTEGTWPGQLVLLMATVAIAMVPHVAVHPPWVTATVPVAAAWRLGVAWGHWRLPGRLTRGLATFGLAFGVVFAYRGISGVDAGSALLVVMLALKLLETRNHRDRTVVVLIAWFILFAGFLREQTLVSGVELIAGVASGVFALVQSAPSGPPQPLRRGWSMTTGLLLRAAPLALVLFLLFPRLPGPFWAIPQPSGAARTGLSGQMSPGDITSLALSDAVAFRVRFDGEPPRPSDLYWRGPVLESFDGRRWRSVREAPTTAITVDTDDVDDAARRSVGYEITLEPHGDRWLLPLDTPLTWNAAARLSTTMELIADRPIDRRLAWRGRSLPGGALAGTPPPDPRNLRHAKMQNPRTQALALELRATASSDQEFVAALLRLFREQPFRYTLQPPALESDPVDEFLFVTQAGFCEHYASAFTVLARAGGLPARIVTGYQGAERNPVSDYWIVRQSDAHAWAEVWLDSRWVRIDPTAAVAPERIERGIDAALPEFAASTLPIFGSGRWLDAAVLRWDAVNAAWDRWVLAFGPQQQGEILSRLGIDSPTLRDIAVLFASVLVALLVGFATLQFRSNAPADDPLDKAWRRLCRRLARVSRPRRAAESPQEYAMAVGSLRPDLASGVQSLVNLYLRLRYDGPAPRAQVARFARLVRQLPLPATPARG